MTARMPAEWEPHERTWMAWPPVGPTTADLDDDGVLAVRTAWAEVANAVARFEPLSMVVDPTDVAEAREQLDNRITIVAAPLNDAWMRDIGPTFVQDSGGHVNAVDWVFNGWGAQSWAVWYKDRLIARRVAQEAGVPIIASDMVNEGGGIHVNGRGTVLVTETVQLDEGRNPGLSKADVEAELVRTLGVHQVVWLERGLTRDYDAFGTRGHVDIVAAFAGPDTIVFHDQQNSEHPDFEVSRQVRSRLEAAGDWQVVSVPAPNVLRDDEGWVDYSYINHYVLNGAVILCAFDDPGDERARGILAQLYPDREIVLVDARTIFSRGGGIHCITQQQPRPGVGTGQGR
ncbi:MAG: agmatine deiminase family protein [Actinomycetes bacterium]